MFHIMDMGENMVVIDQDKIYVKDYKEVLMMDQEVFKIQMMQYDLYIYGKGLKMYYFDQDEIRLYGMVREIDFHENRI